MGAEDLAAADPPAHGDEMKTWVQKHLSAEEIQKISHVVEMAEKETDGEIVPIIVERSSAVGHVKWLLTAILTLIFVIFEAFYFRNHWNPQMAWYPPIAFVFFYFFASFLSRFHWLQRGLTPNSDEITQVHQRAELEFARAHLRKTARSTGILLFVSVMERRVVVLADSGIAEHYPPETWDQVVQLMTQEFKRGQVALGFEKAIQRAGEILKAKLPAQHKNQNELPNHLIIL